MPGPVDNRFSITIFFFILLKASSKTYRRKFKPFLPNAYIIILFNIIIYYYKFLPPENMMSKHDP